MGQRLRALSCPQNRDPDAVPWQAAMRNAKPARPIRSTPAVKSRYTDMGQAKEPLNKDRLTAWHSSRLHLFRHSPRPSLKSGQHAQGRIFFRHTALVFLAIHKVLQRKTSLSDEKISRPWSCRRFSSKVKILGNPSGCPADFWHN